MKNFLVLLALAFVLITCKEGEDSPDAAPKNIFTYKKQGVYGAAETWIVVRAAETGEVLDMEQITNTKTLYTFESYKEIPNNKISVTTVYLIQYDDSQKTLHADVISGIDVGAIESYNDGDVVPDLTVMGEEIGTYSLTVTGVPSAYAYALSDKFGRVDGAPSFGGGTLTGNMKIREGATEQLITLGTSEKPMYAMIPDVNDGDNVVLSYDDFVEFDKYVTVKYPESPYSTGQVWAYDALKKNYGWQIYGNFDFGFWTPKTEFTVGYLDKFPVYSTQLGLSGVYTYNKYGESPSSIEFFGADGFNVTNKSILDYAVTASQDYKYRFVTYAYDPSVTTDLRVMVSYTEAAGTKHFDPFPPELIQRFSIPVDKLKHSASYFYVKGLTWPQYLDEYLGVKPSSSTFEIGYILVN